MYRAIEKLLALKNDIESVAVEYAKVNFLFDFSLIFYDVSTLYFESFRSDEIRNPQQPQVVIGLVVIKEGHTIIPAILDLKKRYNSRDSNSSV